MIRRTFDATFLNGVANDPQVRPWLAGDGQLDLSDIIRNINNFTLVSETGGFVFFKLEAGRYEAHSMFLKGTSAIRAMRSAVEWMFTRTDCQTILSKVPCGNLAAKGLCRVGGLKVLFERDDALLGPCEYVGLEIADWALSSAAMESHGVRLHEFVKNEGKISGIARGKPVVDKLRDRVLGAFLIMAERGQPFKGAAFYNRWASFAGYPAITVLSAAPIVIDMSAGPAVCVLGINETGLEILICR